MKEFIKIHSEDNVVVALSNLSKGNQLIIEDREIKLLNDIPQGHKIAIKEIRPKENVIKYGYPIGHAVKNIKEGEIVSKHNLASNLRDKLDYTNVRIMPKIKNSFLEKEKYFFNGFMRPDGQAGIRNEIWVIPTVGCVNSIAKQIAERLISETGGEGLDGIYYFSHSYGCSQLGDDLENTKKILRDMVYHPNAGGILVLGLGCENNQPNEFEKFCGNYDKSRVKFMICQEVEGNEIESGLNILRQLYRNAITNQKTRIPSNKLCIGLKCGGSDGFSGVTANPLLGLFSDFVCCQLGGSVALTEVPEMFGAEILLMERSESVEIKNNIISLINDFKDYFISHGESIDENPSPGNITGGITTLEEKSLGCIQKSGSTSIKAVLKYGDRIKTNGVNLISAPGNDLVASTALAAAGCQLILFTTGRGTPLSTFVPTMKISTNSDLAKKKPGWIDFDAGPIADDRKPIEILDEFIELVFSVINGRKVKSEKVGFHDLSIFKTGVTL